MVTHNQELNARTSGNVAMSIQTHQMPAETRTVMENIRWETYVDLAEQRRGSVPRMTYSEGVLELMTPRRQHEGIGCLLGRMVETWTEVHGIEIQSVASTTFKRKDLAKGFEADESYYIEHAEQIRVKEEVDLLVDPPPDLVIEVEITTSAIRKLNLFAAMGSPNSGGTMDINCSCIASTAKSIETLRTAHRSRA